MNANQMRPRPMTEIQLEYAKKEILRIYFFGTMSLSEN